MARLHFVCSLRLSVSRQWQPSLISEGRAGGPIIPFPPSILFSFLPFVLCTVEIDSRILIYSFGHHLLVESMKPSNLGSSLELVHAVNILYPCCLVCILNRVKLKISPSSQVVAFFPVVPYLYNLTFPATDLS